MLHYALEYLLNKYKSVKTEQTVSYSRKNHIFTKVFQKAQNPIELSGRLKESKSNIFSKAAIVIGTFVGGPLATGLMVGSNLFRMGKRNKAWRAIIAGFIGSILLFLILFTLPSLYRKEIIFIAIPIIYTTVVYILLELFHNQDIEDHKNNGGIYRRIGQAATYGISGLVFSVFVIFFHFNAKSSGLKSMTFGNNQFKVLYDKNMSKTEIQKLGHFMVSNGYFSADQNVAIFLPVENHYEVKLITNAHFWYNQDYHMDLRILESLLNQAGFAKKISLIITDKDRTRELEIK